MPTKRPADIAQELKTSNLTSSLFLGGTQRPWMCPGGPGTTNHMRDEVTDLQGARGHDVQTTSSHNATERTVSSSLPRPVKPRISTKTSTDSARSVERGEDTVATVRDGGRGRTENAVNIEDRRTSMNVSADKAISVHDNVPFTVETATDTAEITPVLPVSSVSISPSSELYQQDTHPAQVDSIITERLLSRSTSVEMQINTEPMASMATGICDPQATVRHTSHGGPLQSRCPGDLMYTFPTVPAGNCDYSSSNSNGQALTSTSKRPRLSNGYMFVPMPQNSTDESTSLGSPIGPTPSHRPVRQPAGKIGTGSALRFLDVFNQNINNIRQRHQGPLSSISEARIKWITNACQCNDLYFLLLHQLYCLWSSDRHWLWTKLGFGPAQEAGFQGLETLMVSNLALPHDLLEFLGRFINSRSILEREPLLRQWIIAVRGFLTEFPLRWQAIRQICIARASPPCTGEICQQLNLARTPVLQRACFISIQRQLFPFAPPAYLEEIQKLFDEDQTLFNERLAHPSQNNHSYQKNLKVFAKHCESIRHKYNQFPAYMPLSGSFTVISPTIAQSPLGARPSQAIANNNQERRNSTHVQSHEGTRVTSDRAVLERPSAAYGALNTHVFTQQSLNSAQIQNRRLPNHGLVGRPGANSSHPSMLDIRSDPVSSLSARPGPAGTGQTAGSSSLFPPPGFRLLILANPDPDTAAIHQAHLRSPVITPQVSSNDPTFRRYCYLQSFLLSPKIHSNDSSFSEWVFELPQGLTSRIAKDILPASDDMFCQYSRNLNSSNILVSMRCVRTHSAQTIIDEPTWSASPTHWPECGFFSLNNHFIELRRKLHYRRDLPADVTSIVRPGGNTLRFSCFLDPGEAGKQFLIALEAINISDHQAALDVVTKIDAQTSLGAITCKLKAGSSDDDDLVMVDTTISIDLADPFTSKIFQKPVRGMSCLHRECFDHESFLQSRSSRNKNGVVSADEWLCPICKKDARPSSLVVDEFLLEVKDELVKEGKTDVRAILVKEDGTWEPKYESTSNTATLDSSAQVRRSQSARGVSVPKQSIIAEGIPKTETRPPATTPIVIDLMDD